jgi:hypothetical protein
VSYRTFLLMNTDSELTATGHNKIVADVPVALAVLNAFGLV